MNPGQRSRQRLTGDWSDLVVICASNPWTGMRMQDRHIAEPLSEYAPILYVDPPVSPLARWRKPSVAGALREPRLRQVGRSLARLTPVVLPGQGRPGVQLANQQVVRRSIRRAVEQLGGSVHALIDSGPTFPCLGHCGERVKVFWAQDDFVANAELVGISPGRTARGEQLLADAADVIIASTPLVADTWEQRGYQPLLIPYGCDGAQYANVNDAPKPHDVSLPGPIVGLVGHIGDRIDVDLLDAIAQRGRSLLLVGARHPKFEVDRLQRLLARPNVAWVGPKEFEALPAYLRLIDVGIVPYLDSAFNRSSFPLKTLEYLAAGRSVVATDLPATRWLDSDLIEIASGPTPFADAVDRALAQDRSPSLIERRQAFAAQHTWVKRAEAFAQAIGLPQPDHRPAAART
jgi:glycosyltransferase involved in cell wall biosynthesis